MRLLETVYRYVIHSRPGELPVKRLGIEIVSTVIMEYMSLATLIHLMTYYAPTPPMQTKFLRAVLARLIGLDIDSRRNMDLVHPATIRIIHSLIRGGGERREEKEFVKEAVRELEEILRLIKSHNDIKSFTELMLGPRRDMVIHEYIYEALATNRHVVHAIERMMQISSNVYTVIRREARIMDTSREALQPLQLIDMYLAKIHTARFLQ